MSFTTKVLSDRAADLQDYLALRSKDRAAVIGRLAEIDADMAEVQAKIDELSAGQRAIEAAGDVPADAIKT